MSKLTEAQRVLKSLGKWGRVRCEECSEPLSYEYGSIAWETAERDLCPKCWARWHIGQITAKRGPAGIRALSDADGGSE